MRIGIIGAGMIGSTLAKLWVDAGHEVRVASRHPEDSANWSISLALARPRVRPPRLRHSARW